MSASSKAHGSHAVLPGKYSASVQLKTIYSSLIVIGILVFAVALMKDQSRAWHSYLVSAFYFLNLALGGLFFAAIQHVTNAGWSVNIRRIAESFTSYLAIAAGSIAIMAIFGAKHLYEWMDAEIVKHDAILQAKSAYLNIGFFMIRVVVFFALWLIFRKVIIGNSVKQDETGDENLTIKNLPAAIGFLLVFALSYSLFTVDSLMSLQPHWYSTIWGVYCFAGLFQSTIAMLVIWTVVLMKKGLLRGLVNENHLHDLGKFMKAFTVFYAYIGFSQFLLIWYANLPEETIFYLNRTHGGWMAISYSLLILKFALPFLLLLPKWAKRTPGHLVMVACLILVMQYVDIHWMVYPNLENQRVLLGPYEIGIFAGFLGLFLMSVSRFLEKHNIVPIKDPRRQESIDHHVTY